MKLKNGVEVFKVFNSLGARNHIYPTLIYDKKECILVDAGYPGNFTVICEQMNNINVPFERLSKIIITHQDFDHMGGLFSFIDNKKEGQQIEVCAHIDDKDYIEGKKRPIKLTDEFLQRIKKNINEYSVSKQQELNIIMDNYYVKVDKALNDKDEIPVCGGIVVIHVPGHTPGNICLYLKKHKILIAGDTLNITNGTLYGPDHYQSVDIEQAINSLKKLNDYQIKTVVCYHGGVYEDSNANKRIEEIIREELNELAAKKAQQLK